jgi:molybdopterin/thiamine biosynthesis adenylyltransferase
MPVELTDEQLERYSRHILLGEVGPAGQAKLLASRVLVIGVGGLGSPVSLYLAAAGVGTIGIVDGDTVDVSNLQRQVIHHTTDVGRAKVDSAAAKMAAINPDVRVQVHRSRAEIANIAALIADYDFVVDATDSFPSKFLINDACVLGRKPFVHAGIQRFHGQLFTVLPGETACYRCLFHAPPPPNAVPSCAQAGILGVVPGVIGCLQATETIKYLLGCGDLITDGILTWNALRAEFRRVQARRDPDCPVCGTNPTITGLVAGEQDGCSLPRAAET